MTSGLVSPVKASLKRLQRQMGRVAHETVKANEHVIIDMNTAQLLQGKRSDGSLLNPEYRSDEYAAMKQGMNPRPPYATPDLFLTGDFQEGFFVKRVKLGWEISSKDKKRQKLVDKYSEDIFGNTPKDEKEINEEYLLPEMIEHVLDNIEL